MTRQTDHLRHLLAWPQPEPIHGNVAWQARCGTVLKDWERLHASLDEVSPGQELTMCLHCLSVLDTPDARALFHTILHKWADKSLRIPRF